jgi:hypothetical protein
MSVTTIPKPGVKVIQEFQAVSPTIAVPTLPACILGVANQVVEAVDDTGALGSDALLALPARLFTPFTSTLYTALDTKTLIFRVNNGAAQTVTFDTGADVPSGGADLSPAEVAADITAAEIPGIVAEVEDDGSLARVSIRTTSTGQFASLEVTGGTGVPTPLSTLSVGQKEVGADAYNNFFKLLFGVADYPDPRDNLDELTIDYETVRVFVDLGAGSFKEVLRTETFLQGDTSAVTVVDDGDGDNLSPFLAFASAGFTDAAASVTGVVDWSTLTGGIGGDWGVLILEVVIDGTPITITFADPADETAAIGQLNTQLDAGLAGTTAVLNGSDQPVITSPTTGTGSSVLILGTGTISNATIGLAAGAYGAGSPSNGRGYGTVVLSGLTYGPAGTFDPALLLRLSVDGGTYQDVTLDSGMADELALIAEINGVMGATVASITADGFLVLTSPDANGGAESTVRVDPASTALTVLGLDVPGGSFETVNSVSGNPFAPEVGDTVWVDGILLGEITEVASGGNVDRLRMDSEQLLTFTGAQWYIQAKDLDNEPSTATRPSSDLQVDGTTGAVVVKHELIRDAAGAVTTAIKNAYLGYTALRLDVGPRGEDFTLLRFGSTTELEDALAPIDTQNPLGLGLFFALLNAPGLEVTGAGVPENSETEPDGTLTGYTETFEFLESKDVYAMAPLTHDLNVGAVAELHVDEMSDPENGLERVVFLNPDRPTRNANTLIASGATGNSTGAVSTFDTGVANLPALLAAAGLGAGPYTIADDLFLEMENDTDKYLILSVSGSVVTVNAIALVGNDDDFYYEDGAPAFPDPIVDRPFTVAVRGAVVANLTEEAIAYAALAQGFANRRVVMTTPDQAKASIDGLEQIIDGYYMNAALAGLTSSKNPQDPLTNVDITGFTGVIGGTDRYGEAQLKIMDGGGLWNIFQEADGQPIRTRHQLTTDMSSVQVREFSITTAVDFVAKFVRGGLRNFIGRFNITTNVQDAISITLDGLGAFMISQGVLSSFTVNRIAQSETQPDKLEIDVTLGVLFPLNEIQVRLII